MASPQSVRGYGNGSFHPARRAAHRARRFRPAASRDACVAEHTAASRTRPWGFPPGTTTPRRRLPAAARYRPPPISTIVSNQFLRFNFLDCAYQRFLKSKVSLLRSFSRSRWRRTLGAGLVDHLFPDAFGSEDEFNEFARRTSGVALFTATASPTRLMIMRSGKSSPR